MPLSKKKQVKLERDRRIAYVKSVAITKSLFSPFLDHNWDEAARKYIETGDESLKNNFPSYVRPVNA